MKSKILLVTLTVSLVTGTFTGCFKSEEAKAVDELILSIGEVELENEAEIIAAEESVAALDEKDRRSLDNLDILEEARMTHNELVAGVVEYEISRLLDPSLPTADGSCETVAAEGAADSDKSEEEYLPSEYSINRVIGEYEALPEHIKPLVDNYDALIETKEKVLNKAAESIDNAIALIGDVSLSSKSAIATARKMYDNASLQVKDRVSKLAVLEESESLYKSALEKSHAEETMKLIEAIGEVTAFSGDSVTKARNSYNGLTENEKKLVTNFDILKNAESVLPKLKEEARVQALSVLKTEYDDFEGITWYEAKVHPQYINTRSYVLPYIGSRTSGNSGWLRLAFNYYGDDWIFYESVSLNVDGKRYTKSFSYSDITRDNSRGYVWETAHIAPTASDIEMLWAIANSKKAVVRFQGDDYHYDFTISQSDKAGIKQVLTAYELMK